MSKELLWPVIATSEYRNMGGCQGSRLLELLVVGGSRFWPRAASKDSRYGTPRQQQQDALHAGYFSPAPSSVAAPEGAQ